MSWTPQPMERAVTEMLRVQIDPSALERLAPESAALRLLAYKKNVDRRDLTPDQRISIAMEFNAYLLEEARTRQGHGKTAQGRTLMTESSEALEEPAKDRTTRAKIAKEVDVSEYKAQQVIDVYKADPLPRYGRCGPVSLNSTRRMTSSTDPMKLTAHFTNG